MTAVALLPAIDRFGWILGALRAAVAARYRAPRMSGGLMQLIWRRISRVETDVRTLVAQIVAGTLRPVRVRAAGRSAAQSAAQSGAKPGAQSSAQSGAQSGTQSGARAPGQPGADDGAAPGAQCALAPKPRLPSQFGWLLPLVPYEAAAYAGQIATLLADPEMASMIEATPRMTRALRPLCHMLGIDFGRRKPAAGRAGKCPDDTVASTGGDAAPAWPECPGWPGAVPADVWLRSPDAYWLSGERTVSGGGGPAEEPPDGPESGPKDGPADGPEDGPEDGPAGELVSGARCA